MLNFEKHQDWPAVKAVCTTLQKSGYQAWLAGGCVRDALLGKTPQDFDVVTDAKPDEVEGLFVKTLSVGKSFGVMVVVMGEAHIEVATFRQDRDYQDGRHPSQVDFLGPQADALRRDFTVNALFYNVQAQQIVDYVNGQADLHQRVVRTVGSARERFREDHLRMLRAIRFAAQLEFTITGETLRALQKQRRDLLSLSGERIRQEFHKLFKASAKNYGLALLLESGSAQILMPEWYDQVFKSWGAGVSNWVLIQTQISGMGQSLGFSQFCALLWWPMYEQGSVTWQTIKGVGRRWRFANQEQKELHFYLQSMALIALDRPDDVPRYLEILAAPGADFLRAWAHWWEGWLGRPLECWRRAETSAQTVLGAEGRLPAPLVTGEDVMSFGFKGPEIRHQLMAIRDLQLVAKIVSREDALAWLQSVAASEKVTQD